MSLSLSHDTDIDPADALLRELGASDTVRSILDVICRTTGMGFAAVAHVTETRWVACQVRDEIAFGLPAGGELPVESTLCDTVRGTREAIVIDDVARDPRYADHRTPRTYGLQSYVAVPILLSDGEVFGTLCAIDPRPHRVDTPEVRGMFALFAELIATHVERIRAAAEGRALEGRFSQALAEKKVYADIIETSTAAVTALDLDYRILAINKANADAFEQVYGKRPRVGDDFLALFDDPDHVAQQEAIWSRALFGDAVTFTQEFGDIQFERRSYEVRFAPLHDEDGNRIGASSTSFDITDRLMALRQLADAQEQLRQSQKMEAIGQLTGGVAHDFNNLLTPIVGSLDMLQRKALGSERDQRLVAAAIQSAERARTLVQRLLAFARRQPLQATAVDVASLVKGMVELVGTVAGPQIDVTVDVPGDLPPAHADQNQLEMALLNLAVNARDAMTAGGTLRIAVAAEVVGLGHRTRLAPGRYVRLSVADTGCGMDEATLAQAIEPFFSTKGVGKGTGLGLSMVDGLARQLDGALALRSTPGQGTTVDLWLPVSTAAPASRDAPSPATAATAAGLVLLVDDEALVRLSTSDMLGDLGYQVVETASAEEALDRIRAGIAPDFVVTDHLMPGMTGTELAATLAVERPDLPTLIISGYAHVDGIAPEFVRLAKPFRRDELVASIARLRARPSA